MGISRAADLYYTYRFLKTLVTPWEEMEAYELGIIDENGKNLIRQNKLKTNDEKDAFTTFHRLVFNIKRILEKVPFGKSRIASYAAALFLLREETGMSEDEMVKVLDELGHDVEEYFIESTNHVPIGDYILNESLTDDMIKGFIISLDDTNPIGAFAGIDIYKSTNNTYFTANNVI